MLPHASQPAQQNRQPLSTGRWRTITPRGITSQTRNSGHPRNQPNVNETGHYATMPEPCAATAPKPGSHGTVVMPVSFDSTNNLHFEKPVTNQVTTAPGSRRRSATYPDTYILLNCGKQTLCDVIRRNRYAW